MLEYLGVCICCLYACISLVTAIALRKVVSKISFHNNTYEKLLY